jgi:hypothetical protein
MNRVSLIQIFKKKIFFFFCLKNEEEKRSFARQISECEQLISTLVNDSIKK